MSARSRKTRHSLTGRGLALLATLALALSAVGSASAQEDVWICPVDIEVPPGEFNANSHSSGGMSGNGWDGPGANADTILWHVEGSTPDVGAGQRQAMIDAFGRWAGVVQITFVEVPTANRSISVDLNFLTGNHSASEPAEAGDPDCPFDGAGGVLGHAGFPPGVASTCISPMAETFAGNVHFDEAEGWEQDNEGGFGPFSLELLGAHEIGHGIGLTHSATGDIMQSTFTSTTVAFGPSANDIHNIQQGYLAGAGSVTTLEQTGIWVDINADPILPEWGLPGFEFDSVAEGVNAVPPWAGGVTVHIQPGNYLENITIFEGSTDRTFVLVSEGPGNVVIGN